MRKLLFALLILLTWYLAAMFRADTLMISAVLELLIFLSMPIFVHYLKRNMKVSFGQDQMTVNRGRHVEIPFLTDNTGMLPVSRFQIRISYCYEGEAKRRYLTFWGNIDKKKKGRMPVRILTPWNGKLFVHVEKIVIYDYFSLFHAKLICGGEMTVTLLPPEVNTCTLTEVSEVLPELIQNEIPQKGTYGDEFLQLREYAQGDSYRYIHWKQSARTDILWVKEYQETEKKRVCIYLDVSGFGTKSIQEFSAFYEILWTLTFGFLEKNFFAELCWRDDAGTDISRQAGDETALSAVFEELYEMDWSEEKQSMDTETFQFGLDLKLFFYGKELICFTQEHFKNELEETGFRPPLPGCFRRTK